MILIRYRSKKAKSNPPEHLDVFGLVTDEEESIAADNAARAKNKGELESSIGTAVAGGALVRRAPLPGRYYVETRVYRAADAQATPPQLRYTKALLTLKVQLDADQPEWDYLHKFIKKSKSLFVDSKPIFYSNK